MVYITKYTLRFIKLYMAAYPDIQAKARAEIDNVCGMCFRIIYSEIGDVKF